MIFNPVVSGGGGGNTTPFFEIQKEETTHYLLRGYSVVVAIYPISTYDDPCIFLPLTNMLFFTAQDAEINLPSGSVYYTIDIGNEQIVFLAEGGPILLIRGGGLEELPDGWSARYFAYRGN